MLLFRLIINPLICSNTTLPGGLQSRSQVQQLISERLNIIGGSGIHTSYEGTTMILLLILKFTFYIQKLNETKN
jgi:hypothetical protein